jgi:hypothetical protein
MTADRDIVARLEALGLDYYVTGSWALAAYAEPRMTRDIDIVVDATPADYEARLRPAFEDAYLVNEAVRVGERAIGGIIHRTEITRADLIFGRTDPWSRSAMGRRRRIDHPVLGPAWIISAEDLILAKLEWSDGGASELQLRDVRSIVRLNDDLDWAYLRRYAPGLGIADLLESIRAA